MENLERQPNTMPKSKAQHKKIIFLGLVLLAVFGSLIFVFFKYFYNQPSRGVYAEVAGQKITRADFNNILNAYIKFDEENSDGKTKIDKKAIEKKVADEIILKASLENEAKDRGVKLCDQEYVDSSLAKQYSTAGSRDNFYRNLYGLYGWNEAVSYHKQCLEYYKEKLNKSLISSVDLFGVYIRWDIAMGQGDKMMNEVNEYAKNKMNEYFLPLFEKGLSDKELQNLVDINPNISVEKFDEIVKRTPESASRYMYLNGMNSETYKSFQQYEDGESEVGYFENLKVGQYTKPFKSKTGYWIIYKATGRNDGPYTSYDQLLQAYVKKSKIDRSYYALPKPAQNTIQKRDSAGNPISKLIDRLSKKITPKAEAVADNSVACFTGGGIHNLPFRLIYLDYDTSQQIPGPYAGATVESTGNVVQPCKDEPDPAAYANYGVSVSYNSNGMVKIQPSLQPNPWDFGLSCYTAWRFTFKAPDGYEPLKVSDYDDSSRFLFAANYSSGSSVFTATATGEIGTGKFRIPSTYYSGVANGTNGMAIAVRFKKSTGAVVVNKRYPVSQSTSVSPPSAPAPVNNAKVQLYYKNTSGQWIAVGDGNTNNPALEGPLATNRDHFADMEVPAGYSIAKATIRNAQSGNSDNLDVSNCRDVQIDARTTKKFCKLGLPGFRPKAAPGGNFLYFTLIDVWYSSAVEPVSSGGFICPQAGELSAAQRTALYGNGAVYGYIVPPNTTNQVPPRVKVVIDSDAYEITADKGETSVNRYPIWVQDIPDKYHDGNSHSVKAYLIKDDNTLEQLDTNNNPKTIVFSSSTTNECGGALPTYAYPWMQAKDGDVAASGKITGNINGDIYKGSRKANGRESDYLVMSMLGGPGPFCSNYNYILTNIEATTSTMGGASGNCSNGSGYQLNNYILNVGSDDSIVKAANDAYSDLGSNCAKILTVTDTLSAAPNSSICPRGKMYKYDGDLIIGPNDIRDNVAYVNLTSVGERATILVNGNLSIHQNINYNPSTVNSYSALPSLAFIVKGNINIRAIPLAGDINTDAVTNIDAAMYSAGKINTCYATYPANCKKQLKIYGMLLAKNGFYFQRTYFNETVRDAAEIITFSPNTILNPPPGTDLFYFLSSQKQLYKLDTSEYKPRF